MRRLQGSSGWDQCCLMAPVDKFSCGMTTELFGLCGLVSFFPVTSPVTSTFVCRSSSLWFLMWKVIVRLSTGLLVHLVSFWFITNSHSWIILTLELFCGNHIYELYWSPSALISSPGSVVYVSNAQFAMWSLLVCPASVILLLVEDSNTSQFLMVTLHVCAFPSCHIVTALLYRWIPFNNLPCVAGIKTTTIK